MGLTSFTCAKTGLPVMAGSTCSDVDRDMAQVIVLFEHGTPFSGEYDGYGRVDNREVYGDLCDGTAKMVLSAFHKKEHFKDLGVNHLDSHQGYFYDMDFVRAVYARALRQHRSPDASNLRTQEFLERNQERIRLMSVVEGHLEQVFGMDASRLSELVTELERDQRTDSKNLISLWARTMSGEEGAMVPETSPLKTLPPVTALAMFKGMHDHLRLLVVNEMLRAWSANRPAREPVCDQLLALNNDAGWGDSIPPRRLAKAR